MMKDEVEALQYKIHSDLDGLENPNNWALVGNIVDKHEYGENHEIRYGTRKFRGGTRVVLTPLCWGDGYEQVNVIGLSRYSRKYKKSVIRRNLITNYRVKKIYSPTILRIMEEAENNDNHCWWWDNTEESYQEIIKKGRQ